MIKTLYFQVNAKMKHSAKLIFFLLALSAVLNADGAAVRASKSSGYEKPDWDTIYNFITKLTSSIKNFVKSTSKFWDKVYTKGDTLVNDYNELKSFTGKIYDKHTTEIAVVKNGVVQFYQTIRRMATYLWNNWHKEAPKEEEVPESYSYTTENHGCSIVPSRMSVLAFIATALTAVLHKLVM